ncbi:MFS transporter [Dissulfurirhabdus thermomarina]|nr:MFS transporter [Dissulfurirhabdus thermomarina]
MMQRLRRHRLFWVGVLYFAQGLPFGLFYDTFPVYFRQRGVDLQEIGVLSLLGLAWTLKFLWAPAVDRVRGHRRWMFAADLGMGLVLAAFAARAGVGPWALALVAGFTVLSATNDIAIDGYTIELLPRREFGRANGLRIGFYRVGLLAAGTVLMLVDHVGWTAAYLAAGGLVALLGLACLAAPPERAPAAAGRGVRAAVELRAIARRPGAAAIVAAFLCGAVWLADRAAGWSQGHPGFWGWVLAAAALPVAASAAWRALSPGGDGTASVDITRGPVFGALFEMLRRPGIVPVVLFILTFKLADTSMGFMIKPFWVDCGFSPGQIGLVSVNIGIGLSILGGLAGGWFTDRVGVFHALWILGLAQAVSNLGYAAAAFVVPAAGDGAAPALAHRAVMYGASALESFTGGLGTAAFLAFLMAIVDKRRSATEYAVLSSVFALSRSVAGWAGGYGAAALGYGPYFLLTFFLAFPAFAFLPWVRHMLHYAAVQPEWGQGGGGPAEARIGGDE